MKTFVPGALIKTLYGSEYNFLAQCKNRVFVSPSEALHTAHCCVSVLYNKAHQALHLIHSRKYKLGTHSRANI